MAGAKVRRLREGDIEQAIALTDLEAWGYAREDIRRLLDLSPDGCFAAELEGRVVGLLSTTPYGKVAYLGTVIVDPVLRGQGIGKAMMDAALARLDDSGIETVRLNAYVNTVTFYETFGFRREYENYRWEGGPVVGASPHVRLVRASDLPSIDAFDRPFFGASRRSLLDRILHDFPRTSFVAERDGRVVGYLVGNSVSQACEIGPWIVDPAIPEVAPALLHALVAAHRTDVYAFGAPAVHPRPHRFAREHGFKEAFRSVRMVRGRRTYEGDPQGIWSFAGLEKG